MKYFLSVIAVLLISLMLLCGCGITKTLHCDNCGKEVNVSQSSNMEEDWAIYCEECNEELFGDDPVLGAE